MGDEKKLSGRVALVTGAGKRLGRAVALRLASEGADVAVHYGKSEAEAREVVGEIEKLGRRASAFSAELTDVQAIQKLVQNVASRFARLDILVNCAANFLETKFGETNEATWDASLDTNLKAPFFCAQAAAPHLTKSGRGVIINFADIGGMLGWTEFLPHSISKAGVIMLTRILAKELGPAVRVNAIAPGTVTLPGDPAEWQADFMRRAPMKRTGRPQEIADAVMYLIGAEFV
ncbi:MAG TPA: SDR family NAD(P)-dependent oxidoreductase, partial [Candidatus Udaeobacter sp.]|nr:SDR family NAD(P)-dependent oxidoreductase [Candidatus Udaeobacter sp.]